MKQPNSYWKITDDCVVFINTSNLTISFNKGTDRHYDNISIEENLEKVIENNSTVIDNLYSNNFSNELIEEIIQAVNYFHSDEYIITLKSDEQIKIKKLKQNKDREQFVEQTLPQKIENSIIKIKQNNKKAIILYIVLIFIIMLTPIIWSFYNEKAFVFLIPISIFIAVFIYQISKLINLKPMYGEANVIEIYASNGSYTNPVSGKLNIPSVIYVKVEKHKLYQIKNNSIDYSNSKSVEQCSYQFTNVLNSVILNKKHIQFVLNTDNEIKILE
ncbi:hypothetical protein FBBAL38_05615 [Flavobacteria bacterium BAL38]|nr:hypothetical protein FBBAL38_05615 [Flavobacteria bacterium BAL38]